HFLEELVLAREMRIHRLLRHTGAARDAVDAGAVAVQRERGSGGAQRAIGEEGGNVLAVDRADFDLSVPGSALSLVNTAIRKLKTVSIFVHAASPPREEEQSALAVTEAQWREMLEVNLNS